MVSENNHIRNVREGRKKKEPHYEPTTAEQQRAGCQSDQDGFSQRLGIKGQHLIISLHHREAHDAGRDRKRGRTREGRDRRRKNRKMIEKERMGFAEVGGRKQRENGR